MASVKSGLHSKHKDSQLSPQIVEESVKRFQQSVEEVINTAKEDDDQMRSYLTTSLAELSRSHTVLADQHRLLKEKVINDEVNVKETSEALLKRLSDLEQEVGSLNEKITILEDENTKLKLEVPESESDVHESQSDSPQQESAELVFSNNLILQLAGELATEESKVHTLEKDRNELLLLVENIGNRVASMEEELKDSKKKLVIPENVISHLKQNQGQVDQQVLDSLYEKIESHSKTINELLQRIATEMSIREDQTTKINRKIDEYKVVISEMEAMNKLKEDIWNDDVGKLKVKVESKCKSFSDLIERLNALKVEKIGLSAQLETLQKEDYSKDDLIQELETRLNSLQAVHVGVRSLVDDVDKVNNELTLKMAELNEKVKEDTLNVDIGRLKMELREKCQAVDALNKNMDALKLAKDGVKAQLDTLYAEKCHQDNVIRELETRLGSLQVEHAGVLSSFDNAQKDANELKLKVVELEREVNMQKEVMSDRAEEKREAIRQLSFSLEHYMSGYKELRQAFVSGKRRAVLSS